MEYSTAEMTCILKVNAQCEECRVKVMNVLRNIHGVYNITIDGDQGTVKVSGKVNPSTLLGVLEKYGRHGQIKFIKFDGEVVERNHHDYGYDPYGVKGPSYPPPLGCPQPSSRPPTPYHCQVPPPPPPPPYRGPPPPPRPYGPSFLGPYWPPPPPSHDPRGGMQNKVVVTEKNHCAIM
ncbi:unnamed protein product [Lupinus luteus]|uniref:HMA domain-containing protein n=1 Tax=Lupinus luteus TaxID=3873 RepID=A0AAV1WDH1_LUPLU